MKISRELAIIVLKYLYENTQFYFPFIVVCQEYTPEDDDFIEIMPDEWRLISEDDTYQTFELWERLQNIDEITIHLLSKGFINFIMKKSLGIMEGKIYPDSYIQKIQFTIDEYEIIESIGFEVDTDIVREILSAIENDEGVWNAIENAKKEAIEHFAI